MRVRPSRIFSYAAGWAAMTALAAGVVWWGLGPLLTPIMHNAAAPAGPSSSPSASPAVEPSPTPSPPQPSAVATSPGSGRTVAPRPSTFDGWQFVDGVFVRTFKLDGGQATVRIVNGRVELVSAAPNNGYRITPRQPSPDRLVVEFFDGTRFFVLDAMWWENRPYATVTEVH